jgi:Homeodomain-like domain
VAEVAARYGVSCKTARAWIRRYREHGLGGLSDRSHRPHRHPWQLTAEVETLICEMRSNHRRWGPRRIGQELGRAGMTLGRAPADAFTVYLPDRRGRGMSGAFGPAYGIEREDEDLAASVQHTAAECVFRLANDGLFALQGAIGLGRIRRVARVRTTAAVGWTQMMRPSASPSPRCSR